MKNGAFMPSNTFSSLLSQRTESSTRIEDSFSKWTSYHSVIIESLSNWWLLASKSHVDVLHLRIMRISHQWQQKALSYTMNEMKALLHYEQLISFLVNNAYKALGSMAIDQDFWMVAIIQNRPVVSTPFPDDPVFIFVFSLL